MRSRDLKLPDDVLKHVVGEKLRHIFALSKCAAMSVEALRSYSLVEAKITDLEMTWRKSPKERHPSYDPQSIHAAGVWSLEDPAVTRTFVQITTGSSRDQTPAACML